MDKTEGFINERKHSRQQRRMHKQKKRDKVKSREGEISPQNAREGE
jgi:hypothetical protein